jgi:ABC-2 type transport system permease protein
MTTTAPIPVPAVPAEPKVAGPTLRNLRTIRMIWTRELIRLRRMPTRIVSSIAQPIIFLLVMGAGIGSLVGSKGAGGVSYQQFIFPGILAMSIITSSLFSAMSIVWDREFGFLREMLVAPVTRGSLVLGKAVGGGTVSVAQGLLLIVFAPFIGVSLNPLRVLGLVIALLLLAFALTSLGIVLSSRINRMESFQMVMALVMQPMIFLSGAVFPLGSLPTWLALLTRLNPATYGVDLCRRILIPQAAPLTLFGHVVPLWGDAAIILAFGVVTLSLAVKLFANAE